MDSKGQYQSLLYQEYQKRLEEYQTDPRKREICEQVAKRIEFLPGVLRSNEEANDIVKRTIAQNKVPQFVLSQVAGPAVWLGFKNNALVYLLLPMRIGLTKAVLPFTWGFVFTPVMQSVYLLAVIGGTGLLAWRGRNAAAGFLLSIGLIAYSGFTYLPWWVVFGGVGWLAWRLVNWKFALVAGGMMLAITLTGHWQGALYSVYLCSAAILVCMLIGCPLGMLAAKSAVASRILRPINDTLQSIPLYIFLIPAVALFQVNEFSALVAIVLYAIVPLIRYTEHGLRHVPPTLIEAARANGCSPLQRLLLIELPVARPAILLGLNQTVLFALAMLIIAVLVGARGLAEQVNIGLRDADTGLGMTAGLSMAFIAIIADRILRGWATRLGGTDAEDAL